MPVSRPGLPATLRLAAFAAILPISLLTAPSASAAQTAAQLDAMVEASILSITNEHRRTQCGTALPPVATHSKLKLAADRHNRFLIQVPNSMNTPHLGQINESGVVNATADLAFRANNAGYTGWTWLAENVVSASGYTPYQTAQIFTTAWLNSPSHKANLCDPKAKTVGIAYDAVGLSETSTGKSYGTVDFGSLSAPKA